MARIWAEPPSEFTIRRALQIARERAEATGEPPELEREEGPPGPEAEGQEDE